MDYSQNCIVGNTKLFTQFPRSSFDESFSNFTDILCSQFRAMLSFSKTFIKTCSSGMSAVFFIRAPFKVFDAVIGFNSIFVVNLRQAFSIWYKGVRNKSMHGTRFSFMVFTQTYDWITRCSYHRFKKNSIMVGQSTPQFTCFGITPNLTVPSNCIKSLEPFNVFHNSMRLMTPRFASRVPQGAAKLVMSHYSITFKMLSVLGRTQLSVK